MIAYNNDFKLMMVLSLGRSRWSSCCGRAGRVPSRSTSSDDHAEHCRGVRVFPECLRIDVAGDRAGVCLRFRRLRRGPRFQATDGFPRRRDTPHVIGSLGGKDLKALSIPSEAEYIVAYCRRTGRQEIEGLNFYLAFNMFRFAAILHWIKGRIARGTAASAHAKSMADNMRLMAQLG